MRRLERSVLHLERINLEVLMLMQKLVREYEPSANIADHAWMQNGSKDGGVREASSRARRACRKRPSTLRGLAFAVATLPGAASRAPLTISWAAAFSASLSAMVDSTVGPDSAALRAASSLACASASG